MTYANLFIALFFAGLYAIQRTQLHTTVGVQLLTIAAVIANILAFTL